MTSADFVDIWDTLQVLGIGSLVLTRGTSRAGQSRLKESRLGWIGFQFRPAWSRYLDTWQEMRRSKESRSLCRVNIKNEDLGIS
jgi:hypothetical protein